LFVIVQARGLLVARRSEGAEAGARVLLVMMMRMMPCMVVVFLFFADACVCR
jgi:hypothetical protein